jgi:hypothetical protein
VDEASGLIHEKGAPDSLQSKENASHGSDSCRGRLLYAVRCSYTRNALSHWLGYRQSSTTITLPAGIRENTRPK